jgi:hypothetical protein
LPLPKMGFRWRSSVRFFGTDFSQVAGCEFRGFRNSLYYMGNWTFRRGSLRLLMNPLPMSDMTKSPATTPIPVQLSEPEFIAFIFPHLSMPRRGPKCKLGYHCVFNLILWVL